MHTITVSGMCRERMRMRGRQTEEKRNMRRVVLRCDASHTKLYRTNTTYMCHRVICEWRLPVFFFFCSSFDLIRCYTVCTVLLAQFHRIDSRSHSHIHIFVLRWMTIEVKPFVFIGNFDHYSCAQIIYMANKLFIRLDRYRCEMFIHICPICFIVWVI